MQENRIPVPKDDRFMADLIRQIDLLPVPAALSGKDEERINENIRLVKLIRENLRQHYRRQAVKTIVVNVVVCLMVFVAGSLFLTPETFGTSDVGQLLYTFRYLLLSFICMGILAVSFSRTDLFRI